MSARALTLRFDTRRVTPAGLALATALGTPAVSGTTAGTVRVGEPTGMTQLSSRPFAAVSEDGWTTTSVGNLSIVDPTTLGYAAAPFSPPTAGKILFQPSLSLGSQPVSFAKLTGAGTTVLYVDFYILFDTDFYIDTSGIQKLFHLWNGGGGGTTTKNRIFLNATCSGGRDVLPLKPQIWMQQCDRSGVNQTNGYDSDNDGSFNLTCNVDATKTITRGQWARWSVLCELNDPGVGNGKLAWWLDGTLVASYGYSDSPSSAGIAFLDSTCTKRWYEVQMAPTYGGGQIHPPADQAFYLDDVYLSHKA